MFTTNLLHLLHLCDPALPIGVFSHSAGLETYVQAGSVRNRETAKLFIRQQLAQNLRFNDAALVSLTWAAAETNNHDEIVTLDNLCNATKPAMEVRLASQKLGTRLIKIFNGSARAEPLVTYMQEIEAGRAFAHYCIAFALIAHSFKLSRRDALAGFYYNAASGFITNSVKLIPLGQQHGQEMLMDLFPLLHELVEQTLEPDRELVGRCCPGFDMACMQHEQLYSRLYMS